MKEGWQQEKRGKKKKHTSISNPRKGPGKIQDQPTKSLGTLISNQFDALQTEEGEIPDLETQNKEDRIEGNMTQSQVALSQQW